MIRLESFIAALFLASIYLLGDRLRISRFPRRRRWLSAAAGASMQHEIYLAGLAGFVVFYGLDNMAFWSRREGGSVAVGHGIWGSHGRYERV